MLFVLQDTMAARAEHPARGVQSGASTPRLAARNTGGALALIKLARLDLGPRLSQPPPGSETYHHGGKQKR